MEPPTAEEPDLTQAQRRGRLITAIKNGCAHLRVLVGQCKSVEALEKLKRITSHYDKFCQICDDDAGINDNSEVHQLFLEATMLLDAGNTEDSTSGQQESSASVLPAPAPHVVLSPSVVKPSVFDGTASEFLPWFEAVNVYLKNFSSVDEKLVQLFELTAGDARQSIEGLFYEPKNNTTLSKALKALQDQYGSDEVISEDFLQTLEQVSPFTNKDTKALRALINHLKKGLSMMRSYPSLDILNTQAFMRVIVSKLPDTLRERWVQKMLSKEASDILGLKDLVEFLESRLKVLQHPMSSSRTLN